MGTVAHPPVILHGEPARHFCLLYRPPDGSAFCFESITHPIDAFHLPHAPGLRVLATGDNLSLRMRWRFALRDARRP